MLLKDLFAFSTSRLLRLPLAGIGVAVVVRPWRFAEGGGTPASTPEEQVSNHAEEPEGYEDKKEKEGEEASE